MRILVFIKIVEDTRVPLERSHKTGKLLREWNVNHLNPADRTAIEAALKIKEGSPDTHVTLLNLGPASGERWIREGLALGADEGLRIWDEDLESCHVASKAIVFAKVAQILDFDLIFVGNKSADTMNGQLGILLASCLSLPVVCSAIEVDVGQEPGKVIALRSLSRGHRERVGTALPLVITMEAVHASRKNASLPALLNAHGKKIPCWDLAQLGIPAALVHEKNALSSSGPLIFPKPLLKSIPAPDPALQAFDRIRKLLDGAVETRDGKIVDGNEADQVEQIFQTLLEEGCLDHLKK